MKNLKRWIKRNEKELQELAMVTILTAVTVIIAKDLSTPDVQVHKSGNLVRKRKNRFYQWRYFAVSQ